MYYILHTLLILWEWQECHECVGFAWIGWLLSASTVHSHNYKLLNITWRMTYMYIASYMMYDAMYYTRCLWRLVVEVLTSGSSHLAMAPGGSWDFSFPPDKGGGSLPGWGWVEGLVGGWRVGGVLMVVRVRVGGLERLGATELITGTVCETGWDMRRGGGMLAVGSTSGGTPVDDPATGWDGPGKLPAPLGTPAMV